MLKGLQKKFRRALEMSQKGTQVEQQLDIEGVIAQMAQAAGEYDDVKSGRRDPKKHPHHPLDDLLDSVREGEATLEEILAKIKSR